MKSKVDTTRQCAICGDALTNGAFLNQDCGGDCLKCMVLAGDPDCTAVVLAELTRVTRNLPALLQAFKWCKVEDQLPEHGQGVLMAWDQEPVVIMRGRYFQDDGVLRGFAIKTAQGHYVGKVGVRAWWPLPWSLSELTNPEGLL